MSISILVVDDIRPIAEGFAGKFRRYSKERFHVRADVEVLCTSDEAVRRISDESKPKFDLLFTDIDLSGGDSPDKAGVAFARYAKKTIPGIPLVGCSGQFAQDDLSDEDRGIFDQWWPKGGLAKNLSAIAEDTLSRAITYHQSRQTSQDQACNTTESIPTDSGLRTPKTNDEFQADGYVKSIIEPSCGNGLVEPFAVWVKNSQEGVELEVVGCGAVFSWGDTYEDAEAGLMEIIMDLKQTLHEPDESFSNSLLQAKRFVETVTGSRRLAGGA
jgi:CheY-like chemotaxis protein